MMQFAFEFFVIGLMLVLNAIFAAYEMALASMPQSRLQVLSQRRRTGAGSALFMKEQMRSSLAVLQVGITLCGAIAAATGGAAVDEVLRPTLSRVLGLSNHASELLALAIFVIPLSAIMTIFGELIPKIFAIENKEWVCLTLAPFMRWLYQIMGPIVRFLEWVVQIMLRAGHVVMKKQESVDAGSLHELQAAAALARAKALMSAREERIVISATELSHRKIGEIIIPAGEISMLPSTLPLAEALIRAHMDLHTRFPIAATENDAQTIEGYITFKDLVSALKMHAATPTVKGIARPIKRIQDHMVISQVLEQMMRDKLHIALVESVDHTVLGLVTLEDIIEELVGDIEDEADSMPAYAHPTSGGWIMGGGMPMNAISSRLGVMWSPHRVQIGTLRLADWCEETLKRPVNKGEVIRAEGLQVTVRKLRRRRLAEAFVRRDSGPLSS